MTQLLRQRIPLQAAIPLRQEVIVFPKDQNNRPVARTSTGKFIDTTGSTTDGIQEALNELEADGGICRIMPGDYTFNGSRATYNSNKPISILGSGWESKLTWVVAIDNPATDKGMLNISGTSDANLCERVVLRDLAFDFGANRDTVAVEGQRGVNIYRANNIRVEGCYFKGSYMENLGLNNFGATGAYALVTGNYFFDCSQNSCNPNSFNTIISGNKFKHGVTAIEAGRYYLIVADNDFDDYKQAAIRLSSIDQFTITGNRIRDCVTDSTGLVSPLGSIPQFRTV